jgi:hypothetical protein
MEVPMKTVPFVALALLSIPLPSAFVPAQNTHSKDTSSKKVKQEVWSGVISSVMSFRGPKETGEQEATIKVLAAGDCGDARVTGKIDLVSADGARKTKGKLEGTASVSVTSAADGSYSILASLVGTKKDGTPWLKHPIWMPCEISELIKKDGQSMWKTRLIEFPLFPPELKGKGKPQASHLEGTMSLPPGQFPNPSPTATWKLSWRLTYASSRELNIVGDFKYEKGLYTKDADILGDVLTNDKDGKPKTDVWFPSTQEMMTFAASGRGAVEGAHDVSGVLCLIYRHKPNRVNLFVHAGPFGFIGINGTVVRGNVKFDDAKKKSPKDLDQVDFAGPTEFSAESIAEYQSFSDSKSKGVTMAMVQGALPKDAKIVIYACHSGSEREKLKKLAGLFKVPVYGFTQDIRYWPISQDGKSIYRWEYSVGGGPRVKDFHCLVPDVVETP